MNTEAFKNRVLPHKLNNESIDFVDLSIMYAYCTVNTLQQYIYAIILLCYIGTFTIITIMYQYVNTLTAIVHPNLITLK